MKTKLTLLIAIFSLIAINAQDNVATYNVLFKVNNPKRESNFFNTISEASKNLEFELKFNDSISTFSLSRKMILDDNSPEKLASKIISKGEHLFKKKDNQLFVINGNVFYEKRIDSSQWVISNESKTIQNFTCYKATKFKKVVNSKGTFNHEVTAWFCPEIPFSYGPNEYNNLPGLIVELIEMPANHFVLKSLSLKKDNTKMTDLETLKEVKEDDYYNAIKSELPKRQ
ncbi:MULTISPECIES: GLPGLI family protein [Flavobacterium]|uniref:GLPGLI family protein n=1 Tax=Flavobacterium jumunjinense TaxID=998845 RepID=A0ABV5GKZ3_9FLAO|nr:MULTISPECIES: GLPGLI family protein [Flavobacterium]